MNIFRRIINKLFNPLEKRIKYFISNNRKYIIYVVLNNNSNWVIVDKFENECIVVANQKYKYNQIVSFIVAYTNGEILDFAGEYFELPKGLSFIKENESNSDLIIPTHKVDFNSKALIISHKNNPKHPDKNNYITEIKNNHSTKLRIISFAGYQKVNNDFIIGTVTGKTYTKQQFYNWYGCDNDFIASNQIVSDPNNYGYPAYWIYKVEFEDKNTKYIGSSVSKEILGF